MKRTLRLFACSLLLFAFLADVRPCGPGFISPVFDVNKSPEFPYTEYAAGQLGIIKPSFHRSVLFAAYRYLNGGAFTPDEQKALVEVWRAEFRKEPYDEVDTDAAVKRWIAKRKEVVGNEETLPQIYVERQYGGFDFFPNCTRNAFETATATLSDRISSYGSEDVHVKEWLRGQDAVFTNCSSGKKMPDQPQPGAPEWLQKDRDYQMGAARFYSLDYEDARGRFADIALDFQSPWQETADYLVARTLIRQASLSRSEKSAERLYHQAYDHLRGFTSTSGRFSDSAERLMGLVKYRVFPEERVIELAQKLSFQGGNPNFRQDLIDYTWLMDKFERKGLEAAERRGLIETLRGVDLNKQYAEDEITPEQQRALSRLRELDGVPERRFERPFTASSERRNEDDLELWVTSEDYSRNWRLYVSPDAGEDGALEEAERLVGEPLTDEMKEKVRSAWQSAFSRRFSDGRNSDYQGGYFGDVSRSLGVVPEFLRTNELTDWLFTYQITTEDAYLYSIDQYKATGLDLWLMTALAKAATGSEELTMLIDAGGRAGRSSPAYPTIAYHTARLQIELGRDDDAKKTLDQVLAASSAYPVSAVNQFRELRQRLAVSFDEFLAYSLRRPFTFDFGGTLGTIEEMIAEEKSYFNPEYNTDGREAYEREVEERFRTSLPWQHRVFIDSRTTQVINQFFPASAMLDAARSEMLPDYLRQRFVIAAWTRAAMFDDHATASAIAHELARYYPELAEPLKFVQSAATPVSRRHAVLYMLVTNPILTPFIDAGLGKADNSPDVFDMDDWWCEPYEEFYDEEIGDMVSRTSLKRPPFLSSAQNAAADREIKRLKEMGNGASYLGEQVLTWSSRSPNDRRIPEALYRMHSANGWSKYGCGGNYDLQKRIADVLKRRYPRSEWTRRLISEETN